MKDLTIEDVQPLNERLRSLDGETIIGFPETGDNRVFKLKALDGIEDEALDHLIDFARTTIDPNLQQRFPFRTTGWPVIRIRTTRDWHRSKIDLPPERIYVGGRYEFGDPVIAEARKQQFVTEFNTLLHTATAEGWLLGFSWHIDTNPPGDFGNEPPAPEVSRILMPQEPGTIGLRESIIGDASLHYGDGLVEAVHSAVVNLGLIRSTTDPREV